VKYTVALLVAILLFIGSEALLVYFGLVKIYFVAFIPVFVSSSAFSLVPLLFFLIPVLFLFRGIRKYTLFEPEVSQTSTENPPRAKKDIAYGGFLMIGPVPILFGKGMSYRILIIIAVLMTALIVYWFIFSK